jgi:hypothetical protein
MRAHRLARCDHRRHVRSVCKRNEPGVVAGVCGRSADASIILPYISFNSAGIGGKPTIQFSGANVQIVSGSGATNAAVNGEGNLIIGYDESPGTQTGSHNLILGVAQTFTNYGAIVGGSHNTSKGIYSAVFGYGNSANGGESTVTGGRSNAATAPFEDVA